METTDLVDSTDSAVMHTARMPGAVAGGVRVWLRAEGALVLLVCVLLYSVLDYSWLLFAVFFLFPDLGFAGYLAGPRTGAFVYNTLHSYTLPLAVLAVCATAGLAFLLPLIWIGHIGFDRALGYGLKYDTAFNQTHLGTIGRRGGT